MPEKVTYHRILGATACFLLASWCGGCGGAAPKAPAAAGPSDQTLRPLGEVAKAFYVPGESFTWTVTFSGIEGGRARFAVGHLGKLAGRRVVVVRAEGETSGVLSMVRHMRDNISTWFDIDANAPARVESDSSTSKNQSIVHANRVDGSDLAEMQVWRNAAARDDNGFRYAQRLPHVKTQDLIGAILLLRGWREPVGSRALLETLGGERLWRTRLVIEGKDQINGRPTIRISAIGRRIHEKTLQEATKRPPRSFTIWISDDEERLPLRIKAATEFGELMIETTSYSPPARAQ